MMSAFGFANLIGSPFLGWLADRLSSRKGFLLAGLFMQGAATIIFGFVTNIYALVASRLLQGLSAAIIYTGGLALLKDTVGNEGTGKWMGFVLSFANAGFLTAPLLGGIIYGKLGYNAVFFVMLGLVIVDVALRLSMVEKKTAKDWRARSNLKAGSDEEDPLLAHSSNLQTQTASTAFKRRIPTTIILLKRPRILAALLAVLLAQSLTTSFDGVLPLFVYRTFGWDSTRAGLLFLALFIPTLAAPLAGTLSDKYGPRSVTASGFILAAIMLALLPLVTHDSHGQAVLLCVLLAALGKCYLIDKTSPHTLP